MGYSRLWNKMIMLNQWAKIYSLHYKENTVDLLVAGKKVGLEENTENSKCMFVPREQNGRQNHNIKTVNKLFENVT